MCIDITIILNNLLIYFFLLFVMCFGCSVCVCVDWESNQTNRFDMLCLKVYKNVIGIYIFIKSHVSIWSIDNEHNKSRTDGKKSWTKKIILKATRHARTQSKKGNLAHTQRERASEIPINKNTYWFWCFAKKKHEQKLEMNKRKKKVERSEKQTWAQIHKTACYNMFYHPSTCVPEFTNCNGWQFWMWSMYF